MKEELKSYVVEQTRISELMQEFGCTGKHVKPKDILDRIVQVEFKTVVICGKQFMYCGIALKSNNPNRPFVVVGKPSVCIDPANWRDAIGHEVSFNNSFEEIYKLEAYRMMTEYKPVEPEHNVPKGFTRYNGVNITRDAYQLKDEDTNNFGVIGSGRAMLEIAGEQIKFSFNCQSNQIKPGDFIVYLDDEDIYHCSEKVFTERNYV
ncbi:hypothetical protein AB733_22995 [Photobacterium swingsii]|uniref:Uncharacterized protein n=1 Tax=Photobacterium swingsii TaxID=680026 RepID=A0A0J8V5U5_9GAMM|nr:Gp49 family protein [Photobacterium swingsii]KMV28547.1 hypothetical protein AB733_22995 [Photobacterium swingsii]PSW24516.1 hypothetical protein C9I94_10795 [Photobacterium swingsii]